MSVAAIPSLAPVRKEVTVRRSVDEAFEVFTREIGRWWPLHAFSLGQAEARTCAFDERVGGEIYETTSDGTRHTWGTILVWEPPARFVSTWHPGRPADTAQEIEVRFDPVEGGTRVSLEHRGWARFGDGAQDAREGYVSGWATVFVEAFARACEDVPTR